MLSALEHMFVWLVVTFRKFTLNSIVIYLKLYYNIVETLSFLLIGGLL